MKKILSFLLLAILIGHLSLVVRQQWTQLTTPFDKGYWKERYEQSQWNLPLSERTIGDDGLFLYQGHLLSQGEDPSLYNPEVPPLGKYLIGLSISIFNNGAVTGLITSILALIVFYLLIKSLTNNTLLSLVATTILATDPLITQQYAVSMLDSIQLLGLLLIFYFLVKQVITKQPSWVFTALTGLMLGLTANVKAPIVLIPLGIFLGLHYLYRRQARLLLLFCSASLLGYLLPYGLYFVSGHSILDWLKLQKFMAATYSQSNLTANSGSLFTQLFINRIQNLFTKTWDNGPVFSPLWPAIATLGLIGSFKLFFSHKSHLIIIAAFILCACGLFTIIPFWTRYLVIILPFLLLTTALLLQSSLRRILYLVLLGIVLLQWATTIPTLFPTPQNEVSLFIHNLKQGFFHDIYEQSIEADKQQNNRNQFHKLGQTFFYDAEIEQTRAEVVEPIVWQRYANSQIVPITITYTTRYLGDIVQNFNLPLIKEQNSWKIDWEWGYLFPSLDETSTIVTTVDRAKRGTIFTQQNRLAWDEETKAIYIQPDLVDPSQEPAMLKDLAQVLGESLAEVNIHHRYIFNRLHDRPVLIGDIIVPPGKSETDHLAIYPGVTLVDSITRVQNNETDFVVGTVNNTIYTSCCSVIYNAAYYQGISGLEQRYDQELRGENGGSLMIRQTDGSENTILKRVRRDGKDVNL